MPWVWKPPVREVGRIDERGLSRLALFVDSMLREQGLIDEMDIPGDLIMLLSKFVFLSENDWDTSKFHRRQFRIHSQTHALIKSGDDYQWQCALIKDVLHIGKRSVQFFIEESEECNLQFGIMQNDSSLMRDPCYFQGYFGRRIKGVGLNAINGYIYSYNRELKGSKAYGCIDYGFTSPLKKGDYLTVSVCLENRYDISDRISGILRFFLYRPQSELGSVMHHQIGHDIDLSKHVDCSEGVLFAVCFQRENDRVRTEFF